jgi:hypothetical protein
MSLDQAATALIYYLTQLRQFVSHVCIEQLAE